MKPGIPLTGGCRAFVVLKGTLSGRVPPQGAVKAETMSRRTRYTPGVERWLSALATSVLSKHVTILPEGKSTNPHTLINPPPVTQHPGRSREELQRLKAALSKLPTPERTILQLHDVEGFS